MCTNRKMGRNDRHCPVYWGILEGKRELGARVEKLHIGYYVHSLGEGFTRSSENKTKQKPAFCNISM